IPEANCIGATIAEGGISREKDSTVYLIAVEGGRVYKAKKVIFAAGAGGHKAPAYKGSGQTDKPYEVDAPSGLRGSKVMDMDQFISRVVDRERGRVIVIGPNAAIDAVAAARLCNWDVVWFSGEPAFLPGTLYMDAPYRLQDVPRVDAVHADVVAA